VLFLADRLNYQGLCHAQRRHAAPSSDRDGPTTIRMKKVHCLSPIVLGGTVDGRVLQGSNHSVIALTVVSFHPSPPNRYELNI
jgi:hypothetical protein